MSAAHRNGWRKRFRLDEDPVPFVTCQCAQLWGPDSNSCPRHHPMAYTWNGSRHRGVAS